MHALPPPPPQDDEEDDDDYEESESQRRESIMSSLTDQLDEEEEEQRRADELNEFMMMAAQQEADWADDDDDEFDIVPTSNVGITAAQLDAHAKPVVSQEVRAGMVTQSAETANELAELKKQLEMARQENLKLKVIAGGEGSADEEEEKLYAEVEAAPEP